jgi:hypothetical protein
VTRAERRAPTAGDGCSSASSIRCSVVSTRRCRQVELTAGAPQTGQAKAGAARPRAAPNRGRGGLGSRTPVFFAARRMRRAVRELEAPGIASGAGRRAGDRARRTRVRGGRSSILCRHTRTSVRRCSGCGAPTAAATAAIERTGVVAARARDAIARPLDASGFLVPKVESMLLTACSWASTKWAHLDRGDHVIVRASAGHFGNEHALALDDDVLIARYRRAAETMAVRRTGRGTYLAGPRRSRSTRPDTPNAPMRSAARRQHRASRCRRCVPGHRHPCLRR